MGWGCNDVVVFMMDILIIISVQKVVGEGGSHSCSCVTVPAHCHGEAKALVHSTIQSYMSAGTQS